MRVRALNCKYDVKANRANDRYQPRAIHDPSLFELSYKIVLFVQKKTFSIIWDNSHMVLLMYD